MINIYSLSSIIASFICWILGTLIFLNNKSDSKNKSFSLLLISIGIWTLFPFITSIATDKETALFYGRLVYIFAIFTPSNFYLAISIILGIQNQRNNKIITKVSYLLSFVFLLFSFNKLFIKDINRFKPNFFVSPGILYPAFITFFGTICILTFHNLYSVFKKSTGAFKNQVKYVFTGFVVAFIGGVFHVFSPYINIEKIPHDFFIILFSVIISYTIIRYRLMDINITIRKTMTNLLIAGLASASMLLIDLAIINYGFKITGFIIFGFSLSLFLPKVKQKTENLIIHILYKGKYDYLDRLEKFIEKMALIPKEEDLVINTIKVLARDMYIEKASLFTIDHITNDYTIRQKVNIDIPEDFRLLQNNRITKWLKEHKEVFILEEEEKRLFPDEIQEIKKEMEPLQAKVCVPVRMDSELTGIIALGNKSTGEMYTHVDIKLLERLGIQLAVALDYKRIEGQLRKEQELAAIGQMSMEISHEMRNLLQSPTTFVDLILERKDDPGFMSTFRNLAQARLKVTSDKLYDIMYFGGERPPNFKPNIDINELLDSNILANEYNIKKVNVEVVKEYSEIPTVIADSSQLTHLFNNLIINAIDAMKDKGGKLRIRTKINTETNKEMEEKSDKWIRIEVKDDGTGIPDHVKEKLFTPFVTTKSLGDIERSGTGLGLPVVKKVVNAHKGYIYVNTKEGKGTTFAVDLPVCLKAPYMSNIGFIPGSMIFGQNK